MEVCVSRVSIGDELEAEVGEGRLQEGEQVSQLPRRDHEVLYSRHGTPIPTPHVAGDGESEVACLPGLAYLSRLSQEEGVEFCQFLVRGDLFKGSTEL